MAVNYRSATFMARMRDLRIESPRFRYIIASALIGLASLTLSAIPTAAAPSETRIIKDNGGLLPTQELVPDYLAL